LGLKVLADLILRPARSRRYFTNSTASGTSPDREPIVVARLDEIRDRFALADACTHLDKAALLGDGERRKGDLLVAININDGDPAAPLPKREGAWRLVVRFTGDPPSALALFEAEERLKQAVGRAPNWFQLMGVADHPARFSLPLRYREGWLAFTWRNGDLVFKLAVSLLGQWELLAQFPDAAGRINNDIRDLVSIELVVELLRFFVAFATAFSGEKTTGRIEAELSEIADKWTTSVPWSKNYAPASGRAEEASVVTSELRWEPAGGGRTGHDVVIRLVRELLAGR
jgi:hypothetical protein